MKTKQKSLNYFRLVHHSFFIFWCLIKKYILRIKDKSTKKNWCTLVPDRGCGMDWGAVCMIHDNVYNRGGKYNWKEIKKVDQELRYGMEILSDKEMAFIYYHGVRIAARYTQVLSWVGLW